MPPSELPLIDREIYWDFKIQAPPDRYIVLMSYTGEDIDPTLAIFSAAASSDSPDARKEGMAKGAMTEAPKMNQDWMVQNWDKQCLVPLKDIDSRVWFVYQPPPARRWVN